MTTAVQLDPAPYVHLPILDSPGLLALIASLQTAMPKSLPATVKKAATKMASKGEALQKGWAVWSAAAATVDRRPADLAIDNAWGAFEQRLAAYAALPTEHYPHAKDARELHALLFPDGTTFLKLAYPIEWAESEKRLKSIDEHKLDKRLEALVGKEFLAEVRRTHAIYGEVLGITKKTTTAEAPNLTVLLTDARAAVQQYALKVAALADDDAESVAMVRDSLAPIDRARTESNARRASGASATGGTAGAGATDPGGAPPPAAPPAPKP